MDMLLSTGERISCALVAMAIHDMGFEAVSLTGSQAGIETDAAHTKAKITNIRADRVVEALDDGKIVLVAGFQGVSPETKDVTTLGRGGSDATAVALAAAEAFTVSVDAAMAIWLRWLPRTAEWLAWRSQSPPAADRHLQRRHHRHHL